MDAETKMTSGERELTRECGKVTFGGAGVTIGRTFELVFSLTVWPATTVAFCRDNHHYSLPQHVYGGN